MVQPALAAKHPTAGAGLKQNGCRPVGKTPFVPADLTNAYGFALRTRNLASGT